MPPSALSQVVEAGPQCGETSTELPYAFRILRPAHVPIISARLIGVNRRGIWNVIVTPLKYVPSAPMLPVGGVRMDAS